MRVVEREPVSVRGGVVDVGTGFRVEVRQGRGRGERRQPEGGDRRHDQSATRPPRPGADRRGDPCIRCCRTRLPYSAPGTMRALSSGRLPDPKPVVRFVSRALIESARDNAYSRTPGRFKGLARFLDNAASRPRQDRRRRGAELGSLRDWAVQRDRAGCHGGGPLHWASIPVRRQGRERRIPQALRSRSHLRCSLWPSSSAAPVAADPVLVSAQAVRVEVVLRHSLEPGPIDLAGRIERHLVQEDNLVRRLVADALAAEDDQVGARR